jgi:hypothetical protein
LQLKRETAEELESVNDLLENQFLVVSEDYVSWVNAEEERRVLQATTLQGESRRLAEAFIESRRQERVKALRVQRLEWQLRQEHIKKPQNQSLTQRRTQRRVRNLEKQLESVQASRTWKLMTMLHRIKARVSRLGRSSS